jgi:hypothetical protein
MPPEDEELVQRWRWFKVEGPAPRSPTNMTITVPPGRLHITEVLTPNLAAFVTATSSTANSAIDSTSAELRRRISKQLEDIEKEKAALSVTLK